MQRGHESVPPAYRARETAGLMFGLVVEDAATEAKRLVDTGVALVTPVVDELYGSGTSTSRTRTACCSTSSR
ncbi:hypothetical protein [Amycolatopsis sp. NPDC051061]|uniref:hypothetical protein n=1 Tax=Amycolatopsis sp. NPDC051061 TaxID=3155042 RepID=UPI0034127A1D